MTTKRICDKCGSDMKGQKVATLSYTLEIDLCPNCREKAKEKIKEFIGKELEK